MNLGGMRQICYDRLEYDASTVQAIVTSRLDGYMNEGQRWILAQKNCTQLRRGVVPFTAVANSPFAVLPQAASKVWTVQDRANLKLLDEITLMDLRTTDPGLAISSSFPYAYVIENVSAAVARDPSDASQLFFKSTAAGDGAAKQLTIEGMTSAGEYFRETIAMNGVTAVSTTRTTILFVTKFFLTLVAGGVTTATGDITMLEDSGIGTELARIFTGRSSTRYTRLQLYPFPTAANAYFADIDFHIEDMSLAGDEPYLPEDFHWLLPSYALMREFRRRRWEADYEAEKALLRNGLGDMKVRLSQITGASNADARRGRMSQLGPYFPAGS